MDARIEVQCRRCGRVELPAAAIDLVVDHGDATYGFTCPRCDHRVRRPANATVIRMLELGGVAPHAPLRHPEHLDDTAGDLPAFTADDLLDFHQLLATDDWLTALVGG